MTGYDQEAAAALRLEAVKVGALALEVRAAGDRASERAAQGFQLFHQAGDRMDFVSHITNLLILAASELSETAGTLAVVEEAYLARARLVEDGGGA